MGKASLKRWVLREDLNTERVGASLMCSGSGFQRVGAATEKALSPQVRLFGMWVYSRSFSLSDRREREGVRCFTRSQRYLGARLLRDL